MDERKKVKLDPCLSGQCCKEMKVVQKRGILSLPHRISVYSEGGWVGKKSGEITYSSRSDLSSFSLEERTRMG